MDNFLEKLNIVSPELQRRFWDIKNVIENLWKGRVRLEFPYQTTIDFRTTSRTVVSLLVQTRLNRFQVFLKFGDKEPDDPRNITDDITRFGFGKITRHLFIKARDRIGDITEKGSIADLLKQVRQINP